MMKADPIFRVMSSFANALLFGGILYIKVFRNIEIPKGLAQLLAAMPTSVFFLAFYNFIRDKRLKGSVYNKQALCGVEGLDLQHLRPFELVKDLRGVELSQEIKREIVNRIGRSITLFGEEVALKNLITQYQICVENERFYERIAWQIGSIFVPVSLALSSIGWTRQFPSPFSSIAGFVLFLLWILLFGRFRTSIRLYRDCARLLEKILGMFSVSYVYDFYFEKYGAVVRVWPYLVTLCGFYLNYTLYMVL